MRRMRITIKKILQTLTGLVLFVGFLSVVSTTSVQAQGTSQVQIIGIPSQISSPYLGVLEKKFRVGLYRVQFMYSNASQLPKSFRFEMKLSRNGDNLIDMTSDPVQYTPGMYTFSSFFDDVSFPKSISDVLNNLDKKIKRQVVQGGNIPEGTYRMEIRAIPQGETGAVGVVPGIAVFTVRLPQPPILVSPSNESNVTQKIPVFAWTPVVTGQGLPIDYHLKIVEIVDGQTPLQAINSNRPTADHVLNNQTTYSYTPNNLPLEEGHQYAWQITATDPEGLIPFKDSGKSQIQTFIFGLNNSENQLSQSLKNLKNIPLIPGFADLVNLKNLNYKELTSNYILNGTATLLLRFTTEPEPVIVKVDVRNLSIQKGSMNPPVVLGGQVVAGHFSLPEDLVPSNNLIHLNKLSWDLGSGMTATADIVGPDGKTYKSKGKLQINSQGLSGKIEAGNEGGPIFAYGQDPVKLEVNTLSVQFPEADLMASGQVSLFSGELTCDIPLLGFREDTVMAAIDCRDSKVFYPVPQSKLLRFKMLNLTGDIHYPLKGGKGHYNLAIQSQIGFKLKENTSDYCGGLTTIRLGDSKGVSVGKLIPDCKIPNPTLNLGVMSLGLDKINLDHLGYNPSSSSQSKWDFGFSFDAWPAITGLTPLSLPELKGLKLSSDKGMQFPDINLTSDDFAGIPVLHFDGIHIKPVSLHLPKVNFPFFNRDQWKDDDWNLDFSFTFGFDDLPDTFPSCLKTGDYTVSDAGFKDGQLTGALKGTVLDNCKIPLGGDYALILHKLGGNIGIALGDQPEVDCNVKLSASLLLGEPFTCDPPHQTDLGQATLALHQDGTLTGNISNVAPDCPIAIGPYTAAINQADINFNVKDGQQQAILSSTATLDLGDNQSVTGQVAIDLMTGEFSKVDFEMNHPFDWNIPKDNPVMVFHINRAKITKDGLYIDGRQTLKVGNQQIGSTFDNLVLDWKTFDVKSGRVIIDSGFALEAGIDNSQNLSFHTQPLPGTLSLNPGLMASLKGTLQIDTLGLHATGSSKAELHYDQWQLDSLRAQFSDDFAIALQPFGIKNGEVDLDWKGQRVGYATTNGFFPDPAFFGNQFLPERIPLPLESIAYLQIKRNDTLLVQTQRQPDGTLRITKKPGASLPLVFPALQGNLAQAPQLDVNLNNVDINPSTGDVMSGTISVDVPEDNAAFDLNRLGVPAKVYQVLFSDPGNNGGSPELQLKSEIALLDHSLGDNGHITIAAGLNGHLHSQVDLSDMNAELPLEDQSRVALNVNSISGDLDIPATDPANSQFSFDMNADFHVNALNGEAAASASLGLHWTQDQMTVTQFNSQANATLPKLEMGNFKVAVDKIDQLNLNWSKQQGLSYLADINVHFTLAPDEGDPITVPLRNVQIKSGIGIIIPQQEINDSSTPPLNLTGFDVGAFHLKPLAFRTRKDTLHWFSFSPGDLVGLIPHLDFKLTFPGFAQTSPGLAHASATLSDIGFNNGILEGQLDPYTFENGINLPLSSHTGLILQQIAGNLGRAPDGTQDYDIELSGKLQEPDFFVSPNQNCPEKTFAVRLNKLGGLTGTVDNFTPCGQLVMGPLSLSFGSSQLQFGFSGNQQTLIMQGSATATVKTQNTTPVTASGNLMLDVLNGQVLSGNINIPGPFIWYYPSTDSLLKFTVQQAAITNNGFVLTGGGTLNADGATVQANFNNLALNLSDGTISSGNIQFQDSFGMEVGFNPLKWTVVDPNSPISVDPGVRFVMPQQVTIDKDGMLVNGQSTVAMRFGGENGDDYQVQFHNMRMSLAPVQVTSGRADINKVEQNGQTERVAYYDQQGFHMDNIVAAVPLPDTLGLPTRDVAYLVLRDGPNQPLNVQSQSIQGGMRLSTKANKSVKLVLAGLDNANPPVIDVTFQDVDVNSSFQIMGGQIQADLTQNPIDLKPLMQVPLSITALKYAKKSSEPFKLTASLKILLPQSLNDVPVAINEVTLGPDGFEKATIEAGEYSHSLPAQVPQHPLVSHSFLPDSGFVMSVDGAQVKMGNQKEINLSGEFYSKMLVDTVTQKMRRLHFSAGYDITNDKWNFASNAQQLGDEYGVGDHWLRMKVDGLTIAVSPQELAMVIDGRLQAPELLGDEFELSIQNLRIGTGGVSVNQIDTHALTPQDVDILNGFAHMRLDSLDLNYQQNVLTLTMGGNLHALDRDFSFKNLSIGSNGDVSIQNAGLEFLNQPQPILGNYASLTSLKLLMQNSSLKLQAQGEVTLPAPISDSSNFTVAVDKDGNVTTQGPEFDLSQHPSYDLGDFATITLTDAGINMDLQDMSQTSFYTSADLTVKNPSSGNSTIHIGSVSGQHGFEYQDGHTTWHVEPNSNLDFNRQFFDIGVSNISIPDASNFGLKFDGSASLNMSDIDGGFSFANMIIDETGVASIGDFTGGHLKTLGDKVQIEVGKFTYKESGTITVRKNNSGANDDPHDIDDAQEETINVSNYLDFGPGQNTNSALSITIGSISGSVQHIYFYQTTDDNGVHFAIQKASLTFGDHANINADMQFDSGDNGILLKVAGDGSFSIGQSTSEIAAFGEISTLNQKLKFGVFVKVKATVPVVPGVITMTGIGGGFFYNASSRDIQEVIDLTGYETVASQSSDQGMNYTPPWSGNQNYTFAVIVNVDMGIAGSTGAYAAEGSALAVITDTNVLIDAHAIVLKQDGKEGRMSMKGGFSLSIRLSDVNGGNQININADGFVAINAHEAITGKLEVSFKAVLKSDNSVTWAFKGNGDLSLLKLAEASTKIIVCQDGFYFDVGVHSGFDFKIITIKSGFDAQVFWVKSKDLFGAYAEIGIHASVVGGLAKLDATAKGAFIKEHRNYLLYAAASAHVQVAFVFNGTVGVWVSLRNGKFDGGTGRNKRYDELVDKARKEAEDMQNKANEAGDAVQDAINTPQLPELTQQELMAAGLQLLTKDNYQRQNIMQRWIDNEKDITPQKQGYFTQPAPGAFRQVKQIVTNFNNHYTSSGVFQLYQSVLENETEDLVQKATPVIKRLRNTKAKAIQWETEEQSFADQISSPIQNVNTDWSSGSAPSFSVNTDLANQNSDNLANYKQSIAQLDQQYRSVIDTVYTMISGIDQSLSGRATITTQGTSFMAGGELHVLPAITLYLGPTLNDVAKSYLDMEHEYNNFYSYRINRRWQLYYGAQSVGNQISGLHGSINSAIDDITNTMSNSNGQIKDDYKSTAIKVARMRRYFIHHLTRDNQQATSDSSQTADAMRQALANNNPGAFKNMFRTTAQELWYKTVKDGADSLKSNSRMMADSLIQYYNTIKNDLKQKHKRFTELEDTIYSIKANMTATLYGMMDVYANWRKSVMGDSAAAGIEEEMNQLDQQLAPPVVNNITMQYDQDDYRNDMKINWSSSHPTGDVVENSILVEPGTGTSIFSSNLVTAGSEDHLDYYAFKRTSSQKTGHYRVIVRARGPAGNTISRVASVDVPVDPGSPEPSVTNTQNVINHDNTAPSTPYVTFPYHKTQRFVGDLTKTTTGAQLSMSTSSNLPNGTNYNGSGGSGSNSNTGLQYVYMSHDRDRIEFDVTTIDMESDIASVEYAIGTYPGGQNVVQWTDAHGQRLSSGGNNGGMANVRYHITANDLRLSSDHPVYVSVRSTNSEGLRSREKHVQSGVMYDGTAPSAPDIQPVYIYQPVSGGYQVYGFGNRQATPVVQHRPQMEGPTYTYSSATPSYTLKWSPARDSESGIYNYQYVITNNPDTSAAFSDAMSLDSTKNQMVQLRGGKLNFKDSLYFFVRAQNNAGLYGKSDRFGPVVIHDPTSPYKPKVAAMIMPDVIRLYVTKPSVDLESDIKGREYAIGQTATGEPTIKTWPDSPTDELQPGLGGEFGIYVWQQAAKGDIQWPGNLPATELDVSNDQLSSGTYYVHYRTFNKQNMNSTAAVTGPVVIDKSIPAKPTVNLSSLSNKRARLTVSNIKDPQSGIRRVEYKVTTVGNESSGQWHDLVAITDLVPAGQSTSIEITFSYGVYPYMITLYRNLEVGIRITNGNGLTRVVWLSGAQSEKVQVNKPVYNYNINSSFGN